MEMRFIYCFWKRRLLNYCQKSEFGSGQGSILGSGIVWDSSSGIIRRMLIWMVVCSGIRWSGDRVRIRCWNSGLCNAILSTSRKCRDQKEMQGPVGNAGTSRKCRDIIAHWGILAGSIFQGGSWHRISLIRLLGCV